ncbi:LPXTG cell wall anchor domain-containing protein [Solirubrobacter ginsenosidimutans]|uniref:LPXTG cell wall anchor domain-containing protein n=1 Tax=Solirubrobacter ginsenosidimutans TaxID=490573 RepID=A0A9X3MPH8_9ACTN|nr:LPXTG cell wall anchor domain-containing protein [Solirubrobacter ginsenosidimutans]MDA0159910.1 LPXTG cell wall anchor domain-containing protein [Solirubrobacter ginsenosidimutans]
MTQTLSVLAATLAALALSSAPALAGENDDDDDDTATQVAPAGTAVPSGGVATGLGGTADDGNSPLLVGGLLLTGAGGLLAFKRRLS